MTRRLMIGLFGLVVVTLGCSSISVKTQYDTKVDFTRYKTFAWVPKPSGPEPGPPVAPQFRARLEQAVERALEAKGLQRPPPQTEPDLALDYHAYLRLDRDRWVSNYGYAVLPTVTADWSYDYWDDEPGVEVRDYETGTLVLDVVDTKARRLIWRGTAQGMASASATDEMLLEEARKLVKDFPPHK